MIYSLNLHYALKVATLETFGYSEGQYPCKSFHRIRQEPEDLHGDCAYRNMMAHMLWDHLHDAAVKWDFKFSEMIRLALEWLDIPEDRFRSFGREYQKKLIKDRARFNLVSRKGRATDEFTFNEDEETEDDEGPTTSDY